MAMVRSTPTGQRRLTFNQILAGLLACACLLHANARAEVKVYRGATIHTAVGAPISPGVLIVENGKILAVGKDGEVPLPEGATVVEVSGKVILPGLVDTHSHLGVASRPHISANNDGNEMTGPVQAVVRAKDAINPFDPGFRMATAGGITTGNIMPGSGNVIGGQTLYIKYRGHTVEEMAILPQGVSGGLKMANGENPKKAYGGRGQAPVTRMKLAALQRAEFVKAQEYRRKWDAFRQKLAAGETVNPPDVDLTLEPLVEVLNKTRTVHFHSHRADDIMTVLRLRDEFDFELVIQHGTEAYKVAAEIARRGVPVSMTLVDSPGGKAEVADFLEECGAELAKAGVKVLINTDDSVTESRFFLRTVAIAVRGGLPEAEAIRGITLYPAQVMHLDHRIGSLEPGKDADFIVLSGEPFSIYTRVLSTYIDGVRVFDFEDPENVGYQTGGFAARDKTSIFPQAPALGHAQAQLPEVPEGALAGQPGQKSIIVRAGLLHTVSHGSITDGVVVVQEGKITAVGKFGEVALPAGLPMVAAREVTPGLIDSHTIVPLTGLYNIPADQDADETTGPDQPELRVLDAFNPREPLLQYLLQQGITVVHACPGPANVLAGTSGVFRSYGDTADAMTIRYPQSLVVNLGNSPKDAYAGQAPGTRMGLAAILRTSFTDAANYRRKHETAKDDASRPPRDLGLEPLVMALEGKIPVLFRAHRADDLQSALRLSNEFHLRPQLAMATEAYQITEEIRQSGAPVFLHPTMQRVGDFDTFASYTGSGAALRAKGILTSITSGSESYVPKTRVVRFEAAMAAAHGAGFDAALTMVTLDAARILQIDDRYGSIEVGKVGDLVLYDGDPFENRTHVTQVVIDGEVVHDRAVRQRIPFAQRAMAGMPESPCCLSW